MEFFTPLTKESKLPQPKILNTIKTIGYPCYTPQSLQLNPYIINFINMNYCIHFPHQQQILKLETVPNQPFQILNPYFFPDPLQEKNILRIPIVTEWSIQLPKNTLLCFMHFISIADAVTFLNHGKNYFSLFIKLHFHLLFSF
jgi:hypothetical protein